MTEFNSNFLQAAKQIKALSAEELVNRTYQNSQAVRFRVAGDGSNKKSGQLTVDQKGTQALLHNFRTNESIRTKISLSSENHERAPSIDKASFRRLLKKLWKESRSCDTHPYLTAKRLSATKVFGIKLIEGTKFNSLYKSVYGKELYYQDGNFLLVPLQNIKGQLVGLQHIDSGCKKLFLKGLKLNACFWLSQKLEDEWDAIGIAEGMATAASVAYVHKIPVFAAMSCHKLVAVAKIVRNKYPKAKIVILSDKGNGEKQAKEAAEAIGAGLAVPKFTSELIKKFKKVTGSNEKPTDFNDLYIAMGVLK